MSTTEPEDEHKLANAASRLCEHDLTPESRLEINLYTILTTAVGTSVVTCLILLATLQFSFALLTAIWMWAFLLAAIFWFGQLPRLLGFGAVTGAFEDTHHHLFEGQFTRFIKTMRFKPSVDT